eukprot:TRINITY_DN3539_c0_g1_i5.p1 TRINITY_DN3539_c0_g1~~TRINITY_DN3539_c0_g1_i5.p1  ORF type:complete len:776 (-),score=143.13 TRINITY_DN3539_c0_g1_i5:435-2762(-)
MADDVLKLLVSTSKLDRDRGSRELDKFIQSESDRDSIVKIEDELITLVGKEDCKWEEKHGYLLAMKSLVPVKKVVGDQEFLCKMQVECLKYLQDNEVRVRLAAGEVFGAMCKHHGVEIYRNSKEKVMTLIRDNLERKIDAENPGQSMESEEVGKLMEKLQSNTTDTAQIFHDTAGWKNLETCMKCLQEMVEGCGSEFGTEFSPDLLDLISTTLNHTNRFVRETGFHVCATLINSCTANTATKDANHKSVDDMEVDEVGVEATDAITEGTADSDMSVDQISPVLTFGQKFSGELARGLADNWSQVRLAALTATRAFLLALSPQDREQFFPQLLPRLCLNRYYLAEGVRLYSQRTWAEVMGMRGCKLVENYLQQVVDYYIECTRADNHAVREAACQCIAELAKKISSAALNPFVPTLLSTLIECFQDDSWPVRDMACVAAGSFIHSYPDQSKSSLPVLLPLFYQNLEDPISSVRQGAAIAIANVVRAYGNEILPDLISRITAAIENLKNQPEESEKYGNLETGPATYGVAKRIRDNDPDLHENQTMYSCGSLAPKMGRGGGGGGCSGGSKFKKASEPWELADGCVHLVGELANIKACESSMESLLTVIARAYTMKHYVNHISLFQTICTRILTICQSLDKRIFKSQLEQFFDLIFYCLESENGLASHAAEQCLQALATRLGPNILKGRIENYSPRYLQMYNQKVVGSCGPGVLPPPPGIPGPFTPSGGGMGGGLPGSPVHIVASRAPIRGGLPPTQSIQIPPRSGGDCQPSLGGTPT